ncbi:MAG: hypothetical protein ACKOB8_14375 [Mycobacterium sp.]
MTDNIWDALSSDSGDFAPIFKFTNPGDSINGVIIEDPVTLPLTAYGTTEPKIGKDGNPVMQIMLVLATDQLKDESHDGRWRVYIDKPLFKAAVRDALKAAGQRAAWPEGAAVLMRIGTDEIPAAIETHNATFNLSAALCDEITNATRFAIVLNWGALQLPVLVGRFARFDG